MGRFQNVMGDLDDDVNSFMIDPDSEFDLGDGGEDSGGETNDSDWGNVF
jgi:hypothetical protein